MVVTRLSASRSKAAVSENVEVEVEVKQALNPKVNWYDRVALTTITVMALIAFVVAVVAIVTDRNRLTTDEQLVEYSNSWSNIYKEVNSRLELCDGDIVRALMKAAEDRALDSTLVGDLIEGKFTLSNIAGNVLFDAVFADRRDLVKEILLNDKVIDFNHIGYSVYRDVRHRNLPEMAEILLQDSRIRSVVDFPTEIRMSIKNNRPELVRLLNKYNPVQPCE